MEWNGMALMENNNKIWQKKGPIGKAYGTLSGELWCKLKHTNVTNTHCSAHSF